MLPRDRRFESNSFLIIFITFSLYLVYFNRVLVIVTRLSPIPEVLNIVIRFSPKINREITRVTRALLTKNFNRARVTRFHETKSPARPYPRRLSPWSIFSCLTITL